MTGDERILAVETTLHQHLIEDARVLAQIPLQLEAISDGIKQLRDDVRGVRETQERHSSRIMTLEQAPFRAATAELEERKAAEKEIVTVARRKLIEGAINAVIAALVAISAVVGTTYSGLLTLSRHLPPSPGP